MVIAAMLLGLLALIAAVAEWDIYQFRKREAMELEDDKLDARGYKAIQKEIERNASS